VLTSSLAAQFLVPLAGAVLGSLLHSASLFWVVALGAIGYLVPDMWLKRKTASRRNPHPQEACRTRWT